MSDLNEKALEAAAKALHEDMCLQDINGYLRAEIDCERLAPVAVAAYLSALTNTSGDDEAPVAWRWRWDDGNSWIIEADKPDDLPNRVVEPLFSRPQSAAVRDGWRPIATAPHVPRLRFLLTDGDSVLIGGRLHICTGGLAKDDFWNCQDGSGYDPEFRFKPTHWMPLPAALPFTQRRRGEAMTDIVERLRDRAKFDTPVDPYKLLLEAADFIKSLRSRAEKAEAERYQLALAICGGEDAPGYLDSISVEELVDVARSNHSSHMNDIDRLMKAEAEAEHFYALAVDDPGKNPPLFWKDRAEAAEATCEKLAKALEDARQRTERSPLLVGFHHGNETMKEVLIRLFDVREVLDAALSEYRKEASDAG